MIQRLKTRKTAWNLTWADVNEPYTESDRPMLPVLLVVKGPGEPGAPIVAVQEIAREIDQRRIERSIVRLMSEYGAPDTLHIQEADEWDTASWDAFAREQQLEVRLFEIRGDPTAPREALAAAATTAQAGAQLARKLRNRLDTMDQRASQALAASLAAEALQLRSQNRRRAALQRALQIDRTCLAARVSLADLEFQRGEPQAALDLFAEAWEASHHLLAPGAKDPWSDPASRLALRALFGSGLANWHLGNLSGAIHDIEGLLEHNPIDNQGARFLLPMIQLLNDQHDAALRFFRQYQERYPGDYAEPAFLFGWGCVLGREDDDAGARKQYRSGMLRNIYIAPLLLDLPEPRTDLWHSNERSEPEYAAEFVDSFGALWERDAAARRLLGECHAALESELDRIVELRARMADFQDQRYEPRHAELWQALLDAERTLLGDMPPMPPIPPNSPTPPSSPA